jgi:hypothetical protein
MEKKLGFEKKRPKKVLFLCAITFQKKEDLLFIKKLLIGYFGAIHKTSDIIEFSKLTSFYEAEMGKNLQKCLVSFNCFKDLENLYQTKKQMVELELKYAKQRKRTFNLDVGYLTLSKVALFSTKDFAHRIYINEGIFAEATLFFSKTVQSFKGYYYTYKDFNLKEFIIFLNQERVFYKQNIGSSEDLW